MLQKRSRSLRDDASQPAASPRRQESVEVRELSENGNPEDDVCFPLNQEENGIAIHHLEILLRPQIPGVPLSRVNSPPTGNTFDSLGIGQEIENNRFMFYSTLTGPIFAKNFSEFFIPWLFLLRCFELRKFLA
ncbi:hypothetical protein DSO57_1006423 [Entomophthora muscae]|uniref:Uncharacterized protein n=1 Tax=Entomophthora muscae TaxID=34485 RepID=A0ACC2UHU1_9FUNG|nr:hypothetical protein DSO57_1006423 [Entomophthora muscae]